MLWTADPFVVETDPFVVEKLQEPGWRAGSTARAE
jgi:hypothetical protein